MTETHQNAPKGCLSHLRVLDLSRVFAGPYAGQILADFGAEVIKIEHPKFGDDVRHLGIHRKDAEGNDLGETSSFLAMNRGKQSVAIDLKDPKGQELVRRLAADADVVIENFKSGTLDRYGLGYADLKAVNPKIIYCSITGFGQTGPSAELPGYDPLFQALSGLMSITGVPDGAPGAGPNLVGYSVSDITAGLYATIAILAAATHRDNGGSGQHIDLALLDAQVAALSHIATNFLVSGKTPVRAGSASQITCPWQAFRCADRDLMIAVGNDRQFKKLCDVLGLPEVGADPRFATNRDRMANKPALLPQLEAAFAQRTAAEWEALLTPADVPCSPINTIPQMLEDPQIRHRGMVVDLPHERTGTVSLIANPIRFSETPARYDRAPPRLGADTVGVLQRHLGLSAEEVEALKASGTIRD
ncbi:CaiB/BaiF CoA transferase family protein [Falsigemmobacter intermedius]|uniref:CoA transferase n=1 Tax=Falsigemmobacter intermedius TaxID=1553448 RepID=A0A3S3U7J1_9RHOB|nr:CaiB/BaiF CoA-transferase family protein [Falsigemmobacter intermedius]RWY40987.1 CoA transferase [Falsigemmobacter intermedius]